MLRPLYIPEPVKAGIRQHMRDAIAHAEQGFVAANEDEDTITGDLGGSLRSGRQRVQAAVSEQSGTGDWVWEITYSKFRGRGGAAPETTLGADGLFELGVAHGGIREQKSVLFQAKVAGEGGRDLLEQSIKLSTWREAATVVSYSQAGYRAVPLDDIIAGRGSLSHQAGEPLADFLAGRFLDCRVGDTDLMYDARRRRLIWRSMTGEVVATQFAIGQRIAVLVEAPRTGDAFPGIDRELDPAAVHQHRMMNDDRAILGLGANVTEAMIASIRRKLSRAYHPDQFSNLTQDLQDLATKRMQEFNAAADRSRPGRRRH